MAFMRYLGIIGATPKPHLGPVQTDRFERLARWFGNDKGDLSPALEAARFALDSGNLAVVIAGVVSPADPESWVAALHAVYKSDPIPVVVAPGGPAAPLARAFCALPFTRVCTLWVDSHPGFEDPRVKVASQTISGRPATIWVGPLHIGMTDSVPGLPTPTDGLLKAVGGRSVWTQPLDPPGTTLPPRLQEVSPTHFKADRAVAAAVAPLLGSAQPPGALQRATAAALQPMVDAGELHAFEVTTVDDDPASPQLRVALYEAGKTGPTQINLRKIRWQDLVDPP